MRIIEVENKEYQLEFTFEAAECKELVQKMFNVMSMAYLFKGVNMDEQSDKEMSVTNFLEGTAEMTAEVPHICYIGFYAGLLEHENVTRDRAKELTKAYMRENKLSFRVLFDTLKAWMEEDGFFELSGLADILKAPDNNKVMKMPQDHKKKRSTSTK